MFVSEMISDKDRAEILQLINQCVMSNPSQEQDSTLMDKVHQAHGDKIKALVKGYYLSDIRNKLQVSDDDKVMARRAYLAMKNKK